MRKSQPPPLPVHPKTPDFRNSSCRAFQNNWEDEAPLAASKPGVYRATNVRNFEKGAPTEPNIYGSAGASPSRLPAAQRVFTGNSLSAPTGGSEWNFRPRRRRSRAALAPGFTILELLVALTLLIIVVGLSVSIMTAITSAWRANKARLSAFAESRVGFEVLTKRLSQATLNTYWDYDDRDAPTRYLRKSELHFVQGKAASLLPSVTDTSTDAVFFVAPLGISNDADYRPLGKMLTACGFYVRFSDATNRPTFLDSIVEKRFRFRLYQFLQPGERLAIYASSLGTNWFQTDLLNWSFPMADNVIGMILRVKYPDASGTTVTYSYDSRLNPSPSNPPTTLHQLPPVISATLMVIDEDSARRLAQKFGQSQPGILPISGAFLDPDLYEKDIGDWEDKLKNFNPKVSYRVLSADIHLRGAKWSSN